MVVAGLYHVDEVSPVSTPTAHDIRHGLVSLVPRVAVIDHSVLIRWRHLNVVNQYSLLYRIIPIKCRSVHVQQELGWIVSY